MERFKCLIIEDEPLAMERMELFVNKVPFLELVGSYDNALDALAFLQAHKVDILFLDIHLHELSGIELLEHTKVAAKVIVTTAHPDYAIKGYELNVSDYLLKPISFTRFLQAVTNVKDRSTTQANHLEYIFVKTENRLEKLMIADILYIEGMRDYRRIHMNTGKKIMTLQNFNELENLIPANIICRVHKSYMVAPKWIDSIERGRILIAGQQIPISDTYKDPFYQIIQGRP